MKRLLSLTLATVAFAFSVRADVLLRDRFDYPDGSLTNVSAGAWALHSGNSAGVLVVGGAVELDSLTTARTDDVHAPLPGAPITRASGTVLYASFSLTQRELPTGAGGYFAHFKDASTGFRCRIFATTNTAPAGQFVLAVANSTATVTAFSAPLTLNQSYTVVARYDVATGVSSLWVNPGAETDPALSASDAGAPLDLMGFALRQSLSSGAGPGKVHLDDLVVATTFADVLPATGVAPAIATPPEPQQAVAGTTVTFRVVATGSAPLEYQWLKDGVEIAGAQADTLVLPGITLAHAGKYRVRVANGVGQTLSAEVELAVTASPIPPTITQQPQSASVQVGGTVSFAVEATGTPPLSYQWTFAGTALAGAVNPVLTLSNVLAHAAGQYQARVTNVAGLTLSDVATLTVTNPPAPVLTDIAFLRTLIDPVDYLPSDTTNLYTVEGIVTTHVNLTAPGSALFYVQDATAGIAVFHRNTTAGAPPAGARVRVRGPLTHFNGLLELHPSATVAEHQVLVLATQQPLPTPVPLQFAWQFDPALAEANEGRYLVAENVYLDLTTPTFGTGGVNVTMTNALGEEFVLRVDARTDIGGQVKPTGPVTLYGVLGQFDSSNPRTSGYQFTPSRFADFLSAVKAPTIRFTNVLDRLVRPGDAPTNTFTEHALRTGERLTLRFVATDPENRDLTVRAETAGLPASAAWSIPAPTGKLVEGTFTLEPTAADAGTLVAVTLQAWNNVATNTQTWTIYVPAPAEAGLAVTEYLANPTSATNAAFYNPLRRAEPAPQISTDDEYLELVNTGAAPIELLNWTLFDSNSASARFRFYDTVSLVSSNALIAYGGPLNGYLPGLDVPAVPSQESTAGLALNNNGDAILLRNPAGHLVLRVVYGAADVASDGSMTRHPDWNGAFVPQTRVSTNAVSPGRQFNGKRWDEPADLTPGKIEDFAIAPGTGGDIVLTWKAEAGRTYTVWSAAAVTGPYTQRAGPLSGARHTDTAPTGQTRFYRLSVP